MSTTIIMVTHDPELARRAHRACRWSMARSRLQTLRTLAAPAIVPAPLHAVATAGLNHVRLLPAACGAEPAQPRPHRLMVMAIALGISVCMVTLTSYRAAARIPPAQAMLYAPNVDSWDRKSPRWDKALNAPDLQPIATRAACTPPRSPIATHHVQGACSGGKNMQPEYVAARMTTGDFFRCSKRRFSMAAAERQGR
jgi:hypothetical protein